MRNVKKRKQVDKLFIMGAGSSYSLSANLTGEPLGEKTTPLDSNFLSVIKNFKARNKWVENSVKHLMNNWIDERTIESHGLEEAIIKRIGQYEFLSKLHPQRTKTKSNNAEYLNHLSHLITFVLKRCRVNRRKLDHKFIKWAFPSSIKAQNQNNRIITFNYDTLLDNHLLDRKGYTPRNVYFDRLAATPAEGWSRQKSQRFDHPLILKLHGSINWRIKTSYFESIIKTDAISNDKNKEPTDKECIWYDKAKKPAPNDDESPLIIPPLPNKPITQVGIFKYLWQTAFEYLHHAKEIIIVGYSCPQTDSIAHAMLSHFDNPKLESVIIVDPDATMLSKYKGMFRKATRNKVKWKYYETFDEYIDTEATK